MRETKEVTIYTFKTCPYCIKAKKLLIDENIPFNEIVVSYDELKELENRTSMGTVPQIIVDEKLIGGCDDLYHLYDDKETFNKVFFR